MIDLFFQSFFVTFGALTALGVAILVCSVASLLFDWITGKLSPQNLAAIFMLQAMREDLKADLEDKKPPHTKT